MAEAPLKILQFTDLHLFADPEGTLLGVETEQSFLSVLSLAQKQHWPPDLILLTGDLTQDASKEGYLRLKNHLEPLGIPSVCLPGNHDDPSLIRSVFNGENTSSDSQILMSGWQIICLDSKLPGSEGGHLAEKELKKLALFLEEKPDLPTLIAFHHPPLPVGSSWLDTMVLDNPEALFATIEGKQQVKGLLLGHVHQGKDWFFCDTRLITSPSTCFQFKPCSTDFALDEQPPGYRWLLLGQDGSIDTGIERLNSIPEGLSRQSSGY